MFYRKFIWRALGNICRMKKTFLSTSLQILSFEAELITLLQMFQFKKKRNIKSKLSTKLNRSLLISCMVCCIRRTSTPPVNVRFYYTFSSLVSSPCILLLFSHSRIPLEFVLKIETISLVLHSVFIGFY